MKQLLYRYNPWWDNDFNALDEILKRDENFEFLKSNIENKQVVFLTGLRRIGKTSLMKLCIRYLINEKEIAPKNILYISMDDFLLSGKTIIDVIEEYKTIHKIKHNEKVFLFLDEITFVEQY